jgi:hypothetical protein
MILILVALAAGGCAPSLPPSGSGNGAASPPITFDDQLIEVAKRIPGFGGMFFDEAGTLTVYLIDADQPLSAQAASARAVRVRDTLAAVFGPDVLTRGGTADPAAPRAPAGGPAIRFIKGDYDVLQLATWRARVDQAVTAPAALFTDLDERHNRLRIGVASPASREAVAARVTRLGIPLHAVIFEEIRPDRFHATLRDKRRPVQGGLQIEADTGVFAFKICTMGFNARRNNQDGFVTNSHCTATRGIVQGTDFHQPDDPLFSEGNKIGEEVADPPFFTGGVCPVGRKCRFSDSAFVRYRSTDFRGRAISRPDRNQSITISSSTPTFQILGETAVPVAGSILHKVGRTTGWATGAVTGTCITTNVADTDVTLLCQHRVRRNNATDRMSDNGDSGSPVFRLDAPNGASLHGVLWGGPDDGSSFVFSSMATIEQELGPLTTLFPTPPPPDRPVDCDVGEKCCERAPNGDCELCIPRTAACP